MKFKVLVHWQMCHEVVVEADSVDDAIQKVEDDEIDIDPDKVGTYVDGSFEVNTECTLDVAAMGEIVYEPD